MNERDDLASLIEKIKNALGKYAKYFSILPIIAYRRSDNCIYEGKNYAAWRIDSSDLKDFEPLGDDTEEKCFSLMFLLLDMTEIYYFALIKPSVDALAVFNVDDFYTTDAPIPYNALMFYDVWSFHSCLLKSSIVNSTMNNYLGYTGKNYDPVKWYNITNNDDQFYIDLFNGHNPEIKSVLPLDNMDHITLELIFKY
jgi:hypothetical protein